MAKRTKFTSNNFDIDSDLDMPDFDWDAGTVKKDRNPVVTTAKATLKGAMGAVMNPSIIRSTIRKSMPKEYGEGLDLFDHTTDSMRSLYDTAAKEFKPVANDLKRITGRVLPNLEGKLPKKVAESLKRWSRGNETDYRIDLSAERQRSDAMMMEMGSIFKAQLDTAQKQGKAEEGRETFRESLNQIRHRDNIGQLNAIRSGIDRLTTYQDNVLSNYQKKSLELQFRQYFATADLLEVTKKAAAEQDARLQGILKNTGLPEFVKIQETERFSELARNKFYENIRDNLFGGDGGADYIKKFVDNVRKSLTEKFQNIAQQAQAVTFGLDMMGDSGGMGPSKGEMIGGIAGGMIGDYAVGKGQQHFKKYLEKNSRTSRFIAKGTNQINYRLNNSGQLIDDYFNDANTNWGAFEGLRQFLDENRPGTGPTKSFDADSLSEMHKPIPFSRSTNKSIVEIIPGYLARIHRELQVMRTGDESIALSTYDFNANKFTTEKSLASKLVGGFASKENQDIVKERQAAILAMIDPQGEFTDEQRKSVSDRLLRMSLNKQSTDARHMTDNWNWRGKGGSGVADKFSSFFEADVDGRRGSSLRAIQNQARFSSAVRNLTQGFEDPRAQLQEMINAGQYDVLRNAGLMDENNNLIIENVAKYLEGSEFDSIYQGGDSAGSGTGRMRRRRQRRTATSAPQSGMQATMLGEEHRAPPTLKPLNTLVDLVTSIDKRLADGLMVFGDTTGAVGSRDPDKPSWITQQVESARKRWSDISIGELGEKVRSAGARGFGYLRGQVGRIGGFASSMGQRAFGMGRDALQKAANAMGDIYVGDEEKARLTRAKMLAGEYIDQATGKVLTSLDDIKGVVVDKAGNIVLDMEDLKTAQLRGKVVEYLKDKVQGLGALLAKGSVYAGGMIGGLYGKMLTLGVAGFHGVRKMLPPYDVYVNGSMEQPLLYAAQFKLGSYFSQKTGRVLKHPRDVDGPVLDKDGNIIVTEEQISKGLVDRNGIAISNALGRGLNKIKDLALGGFSLIKKFGMSVKNFATGAFGAMGEVVKGLFNGFSYFGEKYVEINKDQLDVQLEILKLLQERLPERVRGDQDGDGIREGSVEDIIRRRQAEKEQREGTLAEKTRQAGSGMGIFGALGGLLKGLGRKKDEEEDDDSSLLSDAADASELYDNTMGERGQRRRRARRARKATGKGGGRLARMGRGIAGAGRGALGLGGRVLGGAVGAGRMAAGAAASFFGLGGGVLGGLAGVAGRTLLGAGALAGKAALGAGKLGAWALANGGTLSVARMALMGITGALFSPIGLGALGLTAAYYGYKYLTRRKLETLSKVRYVQYGFSSIDEDHYKAVFELEDRLEPFVKLEGPTASLDDKKADLPGLMDAFGVKPEDKEGVRRWSLWFDKRFKPIYLGHKSALEVIKPGAKLGDVDSKLSGEEKLRYLGATELPGAEYDRYTSPFKDLDRLPSDRQAVEAQIEVAREILKKEVKDGTGKKIAAGAAAVSMAATAGASTDGTGAAVSATAAAASVGGLVAELNKPVTQVDASTKLDAQSNISANYLFTGESGQMDALTVIRYKTYGLSTMDAEKVKALRFLEVYTARNTRFAKDGASYSQEVEILLENVKVQFGISGAASPRGSRWIKWFRARFLPTFLNFATAVEKATKKQDIVQAERSLIPEQAIAVAAAIYSTTTVYEGRKIPVWQVTDVSPWDNYPLNDDEKSIDLNLEALRETAKAVVRGEHKSTAVAQKVSDNQRDQQAKGVQPGTKTTASLYGGAMATFNTPTKELDRQRAESTMYGNNHAEAMSADGTNVRAAGEFMTGVPVKHPGEGTGGDINSLPDPGTNKGWDAVGPLLLAVAKMTGVDPKVLINMCAIESRFDPQARPYNPRTGKYLSSAVGLFQFLKGTWAEQLRKHGSKYGIAIGTPPTDARANALMGAEFIKSNMNFLKGKVKKTLNATDVYLAHFLGAGGAAKFLSLDPNVKAEEVMPAEAAANPGVFRDRNQRPRTVGEIYKHFTDKMANAGKSYGVKESDYSGAAVAAATKKDAGTSSGSSAPTPMPGSGASSAVKAAAAEGPSKTSVSVPTGGAKTPMPGAGFSAPKSAQPSTTGTPTGSPTVRSAPAGFGGYEPQTRSSPQDIQATGAANRPKLEEGITDVNRTLLKSLGVHEASRDLLQQVVESLRSMPMSNAGGAPAAAARAAAATPKEAPRPAVSMSRGS